MKHIHIFVLASLLGSCGTQPTQNDEEAVKQIVLDFQQDFSDGTFKKAESYATNDWEHINPLGGSDRGRDAVLQSVRGVHQTFLKDVSMTTDSMKVRFIKPDVALVTAYHSVGNYITPDSVKHLNERHIKSYVLVKQDNKWLMALDHNTIIQPWP
jgi:uncharacterized protein (TIGR02246 family)